MAHQKNVAPRREQPSVTLSASNAASSHAKLLQRRVALLAQKQRPPPAKRQVFLAIGIEVGRREDTSPRPTNEYETRGPKQKTYAAACPAGLRVSEALSHARAALAACARTAQQLAADKAERRLLRLRATHRACP